MKKSALMIPLVASAAALLLIIAAARSHGFVRPPDPYSALAWLTAMAAFGVFAVMMSEYSIHGRQVHLYLGGAFLAVGTIGVWDALTFSYSYVFKSFETPDWAYLMLWQAGWITLAVTLIYGMAVHRRMASREQAGSRAVAVAGLSLLWAAIVIFVVTVFGFGFFQGKEWASTVGIVVSVVCAGVFIVASLFYGRVPLLRGNHVFAALSYGMIFAVFAMAAMSLNSHPTPSAFWFASIMKLLVVLAPLAGLLAEHTRLQGRLHEQAFELNTLIQTQQAVGSSSSPAELYQRIVELSILSLSARGACLLPFEKDRGILRVGAQVGFDPECAKRLVFRAGEGPPGDCYSTGEMVLVRDILHDPVLAQKMEGVSEIRSGVFMPLIARKQCVGVLGLFFGGRPISKLSKEQVRLMDALANQAAIAVEGFQLRDRMQNSSKASDDYAQELEVVWEIGQAVASELELNELVDTLAEKMRSALGATTCSVLMFDADLVGLKIMGHKRLTRHASVADHVDQCDMLAASVANRNEPMLFNDVPNSCMCKYPDMAVDDGGTHHVLAVPMSLRGFIGAISVFRQNAPPFEERDKRLLTRLAPMVAAGVRNAELYERERSIAEGLQKSLMSDGNRELADIQIVGGYQAAYDESLVGGDFYDVLEFGDGKYGIAVGDVAGKGIDAAVYTAMARYMIQAYSTDDPDPLYVIPKLNGALCRYTPVGKFVTVIYGILDTQAKTFTYVNAGHEIPFVHRKETGVLETLTSTGPAAGALAEGEYQSAVAHFEPGDMFIFYTDGATEARSEGKFLGTEGLEKMVADLITRHPEALPNAMLAAIRSYAKGRLKDDIAILTVRARVPGQLF